MLSACYLGNVALIPWLARREKRKKPSSIEDDQREEEEVQTTVISIDPKEKKVAV
jgi:hypothetical protein